MSRFVVIGIVVVLLVGAVGGGWLLLQQLNQSDGEDGESTGSPFGALEPAEESDRTIDPAPAAGDSDSDNDGLSDVEEVVWRTNPNNPDTDGDGYLDGEEVAADHDPTKPAPDDALAVSGQPPILNDATAAQLLTVAPQFDQYFVDDLELELPDRNFTDDYRNEYSAADQSPATMTDFAATVPVIEDLPRPERGEVPDLKPDTASLIGQYLELADNRGVLANRTAYSQAQYELEYNDNPGPIRAYGNSVRGYRSELLRATVPETASRLHELLLGYTELLAVTFDQVGVWNDDPVKSLVASRQAQVIDRKYYPLIRNEVRRLESLQGQLVQTGQ